MTVILLLLISIILLLLLYLNIRVTDGDVVSPNSIVIIMCLLSLGVAIFFVNKIDYVVSIKAFLLVILSVITFMIPGLIRPYRFSKTQTLSVDNIRLYGRVVVFFSLGFIIITTILYYREVSKVAILSGFFNNSPFGKLYYYRRATLDGAEAVASRSRVVGQMTIISYAISYLIMIDFIKRLIYKKIKNTKVISFAEVLCIVFAVIQSILSGGRTQFLYIIESLIFCIIFYSQKRDGKRLNPKIFRGIAINVVLVYFLFFFIGGLTGKTSKLNFSSTLFVYIGSPIPGFSEMLAGNVSFPNNYFGSDLFFGILQLLNRFGIGIKVNQVAAPSVSVGNLMTNIYGSFGRLYGTMGILGLVTINLILGALYQKWYIALRKKESNVELFLYFFLIGSKFLFDYCIEERFFLSVISLGSILRMMYGLFFYKLFSIYFKNGKILINARNKQTTRMERVLNDRV